MHVHGLAAGGVDGGLDPTPFLVAHVAEHDAGPFPRERRRLRRAHPPRAAADQRHLAVELSHGCPPLRRRVGRVGCRDDTTSRDSVSSLYGVLFSNRAAARAMIARGRGGSIVNLGSIMSRMPSPGAACSVSKAGVWMLTKGLAQELARHRIRVNAIGPGFIETPMTAALRADADRSGWALAPTPLGRYGTPEEVASTALFLASDESSFFTGEILHSSGGVFVG
jgi:NAD(P)-dependent dehydrogenase (short-subunit alcohol dehydrogenase family)